MTGTLSYRPEETGGRQREKSCQTHDTGDWTTMISRFTVARRLHGGGLFARRPVRCVPFYRLPIGEGVLCGAVEQSELRDNERGRYLYR
ncbi:hypothetical protein TNCV_2633481 [Trichonephila clavipes]|nr:hypothetical protein TNCV_2633481 [Trichonephila clavipes]